MAQQRAMADKHQQTLNELGRSHTEAMAQLKADHSAELQNRQQ